MTNTTHPYMIEPRYGSSSNNIYLTHTDKQKIKQARSSGQKMVEINGNEIQVDYRPIVKNPGYTNPIDELEYKIQNLFYEKFKRMMVINADIEPADPNKFTKYFLLKYYKDSDEYMKRDNRPAANPAFKRFIEECKKKGLYKEWHKLAKDRICKEQPDLVERVNREEREMSNLDDFNTGVKAVKKFEPQPVNFWDD